MAETEKKLRVIGDRILVRRETVLAVDTDEGWVEVFDRSIHDRLQDSFEQRLKRKTRRLSGTFRVVDLRTGNQWVT